MNFEILFTISLFTILIGLILYMSEEVTGASLMIIMFGVVLFGISISGLNTKDMDLNYNSIHKLQNGEIVSCKINRYGQGTTDLKECNTNKSYINQINYEIIKGCRKGCVKW